MRDIYGSLLPLPLVIIGLVIATAVAILAVVFNSRLKKIPEYVETVFHEVGHALCGVPLNGGMPRKIDFFDGAEAAIETAEYNEGGYLGRWFSLISGYGFPILFGFTLVWLTFTETVRMPLPMGLCVLIFFAQILIGPFFFKYRPLLSIVFHVCLIWLLFFPPTYVLISVSGLEAQLTIVGLVGFALLLGSWRHLFSLDRPESQRTFIILGSLALVLTVFSMIPPIHPYAGIFLFGLGVFLIFSGFKTIVFHRNHADDFRMMAEELGGTPMSHFVMFVVLFPVALLAVLRVLTLATF